MKELFFLNYKNDIPQLNTVTEESLMEIVDWLYDHDYVYNPYDMAFHNFTVNDRIQGKELLQYNVHLLNKRYGERANNITDVRNSKASSGSRLGLLLEVYSFDIGKFLLLVTLALLVTQIYIGNVIILYVSVLTSAISTFLTSFYVLRNLGIELKEHRGYSLSEYWKKKKVYILIITTISYMLLVLSIYLSFSGLLTAILIVYCFHRFIGFVAKKYLISQYLNSQF